MPYPARETEFNKIPVFFIASLMACIAGYINSAMLIEFAIPVSQMTGIASQISDTALHFEWQDLLIAVTVLLGFLLGAMVSGWLIGHQQYRQNRSYGYALFCVSALLGLASVFSYIQSEVSLFLAAAACGLQNALVASYRGLQIRTTHVTGAVTDIGVHLANWLKGESPWGWQAWLLVVLFVSFLLGGIVGIIAYRMFPNTTMIFPSFIMALLGIAYLRKLSNAGSKKT